jgi:hypothetical protein
MFSIPANFPLYQVLFLKADRTLSEPYLNVLFGSCESDTCKTVVKEQAKPFVPDLTS